MSLLASPSRAVPSGSFPLQSQDMSHGELIGQDQPLQKLPFTLWPGERAGSGSLALSASQTSDNSSISIALLLLESSPVTPLAYLTKQKLPNHLS